MVEVLSWIGVVYNFGLIVFTSHYLQVVHFCLYLFQAQLLVYGCVCIMHTEHVYPEQVDYILGSRAYDVAVEVHY